MYYVLYNLEYRFQWLVISSGHIAAKYSLDRFVS